MSATRSLGATLFLVVLISFSMIAIQPTAAQTHYAQDESGTIGIAAFGAFVSGYYEVVKNQNLSSGLAIKNTGRVVEDIRINTTVLGNSSKILYSISEHEFELFPAEIRMVDVCLEILSNETDYVELVLDIRAFGRDLKNDTNLIESGIRVSSVFHIAGDGFLLVTHIVDQHGNPYTGFTVEVLRDIIVSYGRHYPDSNSTYHTMLAAGNYSLRVWRGDEIAKSVDFEIEQDMVLTIRIDRDEPTGFGTVHLLEIAVGLCLGYFLRVLEVRLRKRRKWKNERIVPKKNSNSVPESNAEELSK